MHLGYVVGSGLVRIKVQGVESFPTPTTKKQVWCFLGAGRRRPAMNATEALLSVPQYCVNLYKCIELCSKELLHSVALKLPRPCL